MYHFISVFMKQVLYIFVLFFSWSLIDERRIVFILSLCSSPNQTSLPSRLRPVKGYLVDVDAMMDVIQFSGDNDQTYSKREHEKCIHSSFCPGERRLLFAEKTYSGDSERSEGEKSICKHQRRTAYTQEQKRHHQGDKRV